MSRLKSEKVVNATSAKTRRLVGPGTTALLLVLVYVCGSQFFSKSKVTIERHVESGDGAPLARKPSISQLLSWSDQLHLTEHQKSMMQRLSQEQTARLVPVEASIKDTMKEFTEFAEKHNSETVGLNAVRAKAAPISQLSRRKRQLEQNFAAQAFAILGISQQEKAAKLQQAKAARKQEGRKETTSQ